MRGGRTASRQEQEQQEWMDGRFPSSLKLPYPLSSPPYLPLFYTLSSPFPSTCSGSRTTANTKMKKQQRSKLAWTELHCTASEWDGMVKVVEPMTSI